MPGWVNGGKHGDKTPAHKSGLGVGVGGRHETLKSTQLLGAARTPRRKETGELLEDGRGWGAAH